MTTISPDASVFLWDARYAAEKIGRFTLGRTLNDYLTDEMLRSAVERQFEIIGEALVCLRRTHPAIAAEIPDVHEIIAFRNVLIHGYATINNRLVWAAVESELPGLLVTLARMVEDEPSSAT